MFIVPVIITIVALTPICIFCYYHIQDRIGNEHKREKDQRMLEWVKKYPTKFIIVDGELRVRRSVKKDLKPFENIKY